MDCGRLAFQKLLETHDMRKLEQLEPHGLFVDPAGRCRKVELQQALAERVSTAVAAGQFPVCLVRK